MENNGGCSSCKHVQQHCGTLWSHEQGHRWRVCLYSMHPRLSTKQHAVVRSAGTGQATAGSCRPSLSAGSAVTCHLMQCPLYNQAPTAVPQPQLLPYHACNTEPHRQASAQKRQAENQTPNAHTLGRRAQAAWWHTHHCCHSTGSAAGCNGVHCKCHGSSRVSHPAQKTLLLEQQHPACREYAGAAQCGTAMPCKAVCDCDPLHGKYA